MEDTTAPVRVSVIVPAYNAEKHLAQCVDSVLAQTERSIEVICVDDGSTDSTLDMLRSYSESDSRVQVIEQPNSGGGTARNTGMNVATGKYLSFLDADDYFDPEMIERAADRMDETDADIVVYRSWVHQEEDGSTYDADWTFVEGNIPETEPFSCAEMPDAIFNTFANVPWNKMFRASFVKESRLRFQEIKRTNDLLFVCSALALARRIATVDMHLAHYRMGTPMSCQATNDRDPLGFFKAFSALADFLEERGMMETLRTSFIRHALDGIVANINSQGTLKGFSTLYRSRNDFETKLGILSDSDRISNEEQMEEYRQLMSMSLEEFLFARLRKVQSQRNTAWHTGRQLEKRMWEAIDCCSDLEGRIADLKKDIEQKDIWISELENSTSYRLGSALTKPARLIKDSRRKG